MKLVETWTEYIPFKVIEGSEPRFIAQFKIPVSYLSEPDREHFQRTRLGEESVTFEVNVIGQKGSRGHPILVVIDDIITKSGRTFEISAKSSAGVTYANNFSGMRQANFEQNVVFLIYSTVAKIIKTYIDRYQPELVQFSAAHAGLQPVYHVLCMQAEKKFGYKYGNPRRGRENHNFVILSKGLFSKLKAYFKQGQEQGVMA